MPTYTRRERIVVFILGLAAFTGVLNVYLLTPFLGLVARQFRLGEAAVGQLSTAHALVGAIVGLLAAPLIDRYQRKRLLQFGLAAAGLGAALSGIAPSFAVLLVARAAAGFGAAFMLSCCYAAVGDVFPDANRRNRCLGILLSAGGMGAVVGFPILTQLATTFGWRWAVASLLIPITVVMTGAGLLPERDLAVRRGGLVADYLVRYRHVLAHGEVTLLLTGSLLWYVVWTVPLIYGVTVWIGLFRLSLSGYGWVFSISGVTYVLGSNLAPALLRRVSSFRAFVAASVVQLAAALGFALAVSNLWGSLVVYCGLFVGAAAVANVSLSVLTQDALPEARGAVLSLSGMMSQAGSALGGVLGALILAALGAGALVPVIGLLIPASVLAGWLSVRRQVTVVEQVESLIVSGSSLPSRPPLEPGAAQNT